MYEDVEADDAGGETGPGIPDDLKPVVPDPHAAQPLEPTDGALYHPSDFAQPAPVGRAALADVRLDPQEPQDPTGRLAVVPAVRVQLVGQLLGPPRLPADPREVHHDRDDLGVVAGVGTGRPERQRHAPPIDQERVLGPELPAVHRALAGLLTAPE